jgi:prophage regulatory protein
MSIHLKIERKPETLERYGISRSTFYTRIKDGLIPPTISLGDRAVGSLEHETSAVIATMAAGQTQDEIKSLVTSLVEARKDMMEVFK